VVLTRTAGGLGPMRDACHSARTAGVPAQPGFPYQMRPRERAPNGFIGVFRLLPGPRLRLPAANPHP